MVAASRQTILIEVAAWVLGPLAVHVSAAAKGLTVTHVPSGLRIQSRLNDKDQALAAVERLLQLPGVNWHSQHPITEENKATILQIVSELPKRPPTRGHRIRRTSRPMIAGDSTVKEEETL